MSIDVTTVSVPINVSASGTKVEATVSGGIGPAGTAATITIGTVTTGAAGSSAAVVNAGTSSAAVLNFTIPAGATGPAGTTTWAGITDKPSTFAPSAHTHTKGEVGLGNVDNTADASKPVSTAQAAADAAVASAAAADATSKANAAQAYAIQRANHTGTQAISTVSGLQAALDGKQAAGSYAATVHGHTISQVTGLQAALDAKATPADVTSAVAAVVDAAPAALDTLNELAAALGDDANFASTVTTALAGKAESSHAAQHGAAGSDPITVAASQISGGALPANAALDFSDGTRDSEVGGWGFGVELTADTVQYATVEYNAITVHNSNGSTTLTPAGLTLHNATQVIVGSFDNSTGGANGISMICAVGYELNWQGGHLRCTADGGANTAAILVDSPLEFPVPPGNTPGADNVQIDYVGITFTDGSMQTTAAIPLPVSPTDGDLLVWSADDAQWQAQQPTAAIPLPASPNDGDVLRWNASAAAWQPSADYSLPTASDTILGGVIIGSGVTITDGVISVSTDYAPSSHNHGSSEISVADLGLSAFNTDDNLTEVLGYISTAIMARASSVHSHAASDITSGSLDIARIPTGTTSTTVCLGNDARLSNARTPTAHTHDIVDITGLGTVLNAKAPLASPTFTGTVSGITKTMVGLGNVPNTDATLRANHTGTQTLSTISDAGTAASRNVPATGNATSTQVVIGSDTRLTDSRTPSAHKSTHATGGSDALTAADIGAASASHTHAASDITSGTVATARLGSGTAGAYTWLAGDQAWKSFAFIPGFSGFADADDWASRVTTNGGSVSTSTMTAVYQFCLAIAAAGIRDRFFRLNLFCGTGLNSALVPLYRGPTRTGTQYGNTTDTNVGPFVSGDYVETGGTGGLKGNGSTKYLNTGLTHVDIGDSLAHVMGSFTQTDSDYFGGIVGSGASVTYSYRNSLIIENTGSGRKTRVSRFAGGIQPATVLTANQKVIVVGSRTGSTEVATYYDQQVVENGTQGTSFSLSDPAYAAYVLAYNEGGTVTRPTFAYVRAYSMGLSMNVAQVAALVSALRQFEDAMGRR